MLPGSIIVVSRKWHSPSIRVQHLSNGIAIDIAEDDFCKAFALAFRISFWHRLFGRQADFQLIARKAWQAVIEEMKMATIYSPPPVPKE